MNTEVVYKEVQIIGVSLSDAAKKITHRMIQVLLDGKTLIRPVDGWVPTYLPALSIAKAKMIIDALVDGGMKVDDGRLLLTDKQLSELQMCLNYPHLVSSEEWDRIIKLKD
jgi:hypothetical protein